MAKGGAVEGIIPPEPLGESPPFPMSGLTWSTASLGGMENAGGTSFGDDAVSKHMRRVELISERAFMVKRGDSLRHPASNSSMFVVTAEKLESSGKDG